MKINKIISAVVLSSVLIVPAIGLAQDYEVPNVDVMNALNSIANWIFSILLLVAVIFIILGAFNFITAGGDSEKLGKARNNIFYALIGIAVAFLAKGLIVLVGRIMGYDVTFF